MASALVEKLVGVRDLKKILETTVKELGESFGAESCQLMLSNPLDPNVSSICEYRASKEEFSNLATLFLPLTLQGKSFGYMSMARQQVVSADETNAIRVILAELGEIIRHAQINDIVQRNTFRETFLVEIGNVMAYSLGIGDALFMVVNILGKVLHCSRCIFICTDDTQAGWKCYEFWQQNEVKSSQEFRWPTTDSALVAQTLLAGAPLVIFEGQENSYSTPVQEELQFIGVKSALAVALRSTEATHGCVILQQCDHRRAWTRGEIDMVQNVADKVSEALIKLPAEKRAREPIMQLHQRTVTIPEEAKGKETIQSVRRALKGALGQQAIPVAQKTSQPVPPAVVTPPMPPPPVVPSSPQLQAPPLVVAPPQAGQTGRQVSGTDNMSFGTDVASAAAGQVGSPDLAAPGTGKSLSSILGGIQRSAGGAAMSSLDFGIPTQPEMPPPLQGESVSLGETSAGGVTVPADVDSSVSQAGWGEPGTSSSTTAQNAWGNLDAIPTPGTGGAHAGSATSQWGNLDAIPTPGAGAQEGAPAGQWGNLDAIPTPSSGPARGGLGGAIGARGKAQPTTQSPLLASLHKDKSKFGQQGVQPVEFIEGPPVQIDEKAAQAKLQQILSSSNPTSDYIFATPGLDARTLGRIDGWVTQIEQKDKYLNGHARQVAEYSMAIAQQLGLGQQEIDTIRLAALVHDVGKLGAAPAILQKLDEELSDNELLVRMKHPLDGAELLDSFPELKHLAPIVRSHHEEFDGNGYPAGLKGEQIPLASRIIHVADSYHAMISPRRNQSGISPTEAQQQLTKGAGSQWDPRCIEALLLAIMQQKVPAQVD